MICSRPCSRHSAIISSYRRGVRWLGEVYLGSDEAQVDILGADEAEDEVEYWLRDVVHLVRRDKKGLQGVVFESFRPEFDVLMADVGKDGSLGVHLVVLSCLGDNTSLDVAEEPKWMRVR